ncbi:YoaK family protein [Peredibacter starrii]|uniref:YoaK family protein n=1 Tax=Peredibacter starrii TaxID=28202 RepID=A0AAX4HLT1_9BACT|nr:YoaK family protein [Peredibacter starrii]WPU63879.1 YoaK family protein [Peredibacter starrii]
MLGVLDQRFFLWILAFSAGFIDTATFIGAAGIFSAHVTGNFVVFAATLASGHHAGLSKLVTFPFFVAGVLMVGYFNGKLCKKRGFFFMISGLVILSGVGLIFFKDGTSFYACVMGLVFAMGMQNAAHKIFLKNTPTSTVMTGNVTQFFLDLISKVKSPIYFSTIEMVVSFFVGCVAAALCGIQFGIVSVILPGVLLLVSSIMIKD